MHRSLALAFKEGGASLVHPFGVQGRRPSDAQQALLGEGGPPHHRSLAWQAMVRPFLNIDAVHLLSGSKSAYLSCIAKEGLPFLLHTLLR